jgi:hypothetical protein
MTAFEKMEFRVWQVAQIRTGGALRHVAVPRSPNDQRGWAMIV